jgi:hypothetical protein
MPDTALEDQGHAAITQTFAFGDTVLLDVPKDRPDRDLRPLKPRVENRHGADCRLPPFGDRDLCPLPPPGRSSTSARIG